MNIDNAIALVSAEVVKATEKFPTWPSDPLHAVAVLNEEVGELNKALLQLTYEPGKSTPSDVMTEAVQVAAMSLRFLLSLDSYRYRQGRQHSQDSQLSQEEPNTDPTFFDLYMSCETSGEEFNLVGLPLDNDTYIRSSEQSLQNIMIIEFLKRHPNVNLGVEFGYSVTASAATANLKEEHEAEFN